MLLPALDRALVHPSLMAASRVAVCPSFARSRVIPVTSLQQPLLFVRVTAQLFRMPVLSRQRLSRLSLERGVTACSYSRYNPSADIPSCSPTSPPKLPARRSMLPMAQMRALAQRRLALPSAQRLQKAMQVSRLRAAPTLEQCQSGWARPRGLSTLFWPRI
jgi:hypothetical protein